MSLMLKAIFKNFSSIIHKFHSAILPMDLHDWTFTDSLKFKFKSQ
jgi:hypothetical protein